ncbi:MAG: response regulator [Alphaproteobacteria bacterium]|nr:response regulator [Alphaproteobacteria bacterium]MCB9695187.1 response regulator [Alphaproteobacteria bacterium]
MRRVVIVDDDRFFAESVHDELARDGYAVDVLHDAGGLEAALAGDAPHVLLLDVRLGGPGSRDLDGLTLVPSVLQSWPYTRVIVVTGYATPEVVRRTYASGAVDLLQKGELLVEMLRFKVRRAADEADRAIAADPEGRERELRQAWSECRTETDRNRKGQALERTVGMLLAAIPGLGSHQRITNGTEEFDLVVTNQSRNVFLQQQGPVWLVECKNWATPTGVPEVRPLLEKMRNRRGRCRLGIAVSMNGFAATVAEDLLRTSTTDHLVVLVTGDDLDDWIGSEDREGFLVDRIMIATSR